MIRKMTRMPYRSRGSEPLDVVMGLNDFGIEEGSGSRSDKNLRSSGSIASSHSHVIIRTGWPIGGLCIDN